MRSGWFVLVKTKMALAAFNPATAATLLHASSREGIDRSEPHNPFIPETKSEFVLLVVLLFLFAVTLIAIVSIYWNRRNNQRIYLKNAEKLLAKEGKIKEVKERLESTINTAPVAYVLTIDGIVVEVNDYMKRHVGMESGDEISRYYDGSTEGKGWLDLTLQQKKMSNQVIRFKMANGETHRFLSNFTMIEYKNKIAFIMWAMDIEESERKNDKLFIAQQSLQTVMDTLPIAVWVIDIESALLTYVNHVCLELFKLHTFGKDKKDYPVTDFLQEKSVGETSMEEKLNRIIYSIEPVSTELVCRKADGTLFDALVTAQIIDYKGKSSSLGIIKDLTAEKEYERQLIHAAKKEKEANQLKSSFLVNMSHEIRTPMNAIIGLTDIELRKNQPKEMKDVYRKIGSSAKNLLQIINDILDLSKIEANKMDLLLEEFDLEDVMENALLVVAPRLEEKDVELMLHVSKDLPRYLVGDKTRLWQLLKNFLDNAAKYTEEGEILLSASVRADASDEDTIGITFVVEDTGFGIDEKQLQKVFVPYEQFYNEAQKKYKGTGLGMAISKMLCEIMGGSLQIESKPGEGTVVRIHIPFNRSRNQEEILRVMMNPALEDKSVLVVDDDERSLDTVASLFDDSNVKYVLTCNGSEMAERKEELKNGRDSFDLALLDCKAKGGGAINMAKEIKSYIPDMKIFLMATACQKQLLQTDDLEGLVEGIIEKPFVPSAMVAQICEAFGFADEAAPCIEFVQFRDVRILLCEDNLINQEVASGMLGEFGIQPTIAENGKEGMELLKEDPNYDLIFMDLQMPVMDGYQATRGIRGELGLTDVPIVSLTADAMTEVMSQCLEAGMNAHLTKPIDFEGLQRVLLKWLPNDKRV